MPFFNKIFLMVSTKLHPSVHGPLCWSTGFIVLRFLINVINNINYQEYLLISKHCIVCS